MFREFKVGDHVSKTQGDYTFHGVIVSVFPKRSGATRYVVESPDGVLFILNSGQLVHSDGVQ